MIHKIYAKMYAALSVNTHLDVTIFEVTEAVFQRCSVKKVFLLLEILQNSQESTCARVSFLIHMQAKVAYT